MRVTTGRLHWPDVFGIAWIALFALLYLSPGLKDGVNFGPTDVGGGLSLLTHSLPAVGMHNNLNSDTITQGVPWNTLNWEIVHQGQLPLWNSISGTGLPQLFNFESASVSLPDAVGYLFPLSMSFIATVAMKLLIAGIGVYVCCRVLGLRSIESAVAGTTFMLSGSFSGWLGWAVSGPMAWGGWIVAGCVLSYRSRGQIRQVVLLAIVTALSIYGGFPESSILLALGLVAFLSGTYAASCLTRRRYVRRVGVIRVLIGSLGGCLLSAPLLLPGIPLLSASARNGTISAGSLPLRVASLIFAQGYFGLPIKGSFAWQNYYETAAYVGVVAVVLAMVAVLTEWRRPVVVGLFVGTVGSFLVVYRLGSDAPIQHILGAIGLNAVAFQRMQSVLELFIAILCGFGLRVILDRWHLRSVRLASVLSVLTVSLIIATLWATLGHLGLPPDMVPGKNGVPTHEVLDSLRRSSLFWPAGSLVLVIVVLVGRTIFHRASVPAIRSRFVFGGSVLVSQSMFLLFAGVGINSYSHNAYPVTPEIATVQKIVGTSILGLDGGNVDCAKSEPRDDSHCGLRLWQKTGVYPEMNIPYGLDELAMHDPLIPQAYFDSWPIPNAEQRARMINLFVPDIDTVRLAQRYGVSYVLALPGEAPPGGMTLVTRISGESLYKVPDSSQFSFVGSNAASASVTSTSHLSDNSYQIRVATKSTTVLVARITDIDGWHATADGRSTPLSKYDQSFLSVAVPAGTHTIDFYYWPRTFTEGIVIAGLTILGFAMWTIVTTIVLSVRQRTARQRVWARMTNSTRWTTRCHD